MLHTFNKFKGLILGSGVLIAVGLFIFLKTNKANPNNLPTSKKEAAVGQDICGEFPKEWVQSVLGKDMIKTEKVEMRGLNVCQYYVDETNFVTLRLNALSFEDQKKGQQALGRSVTTNKDITLNHFIAVQDDGRINAITLEINTNLFLAVDRSSTKAANETELVSFAIKVAERIQKGENQAVAQKPVAEKSETDSVPLPQETDIVNTFFQLIDEGKPDEAVMMMTSNITSDDSAKQAFGVQFNAMKSVKVVSIEEAVKENWTQTRHEYMITLDVLMDPSSANQPIPYYGFGKGSNVRFVTLVKEDGRWKFESISTGP